MSRARSFFSFRQLRHVAVDDAQRQALDDRGLADAGLADQDGIVLGAPGQDLDGAADLLVAADHRVELAVARRLGEVAGVFLQRLVGVLGRGGIGGAALADGVDRLVQAEAVTPARARMRPASVSFSIASASSRRSTVTNLSLALSAAFSAVSNRRSSSRVACGCEAAPETFGCRAMTASTSRPDLGGLAAGAVDQPGGHALRDRRAAP